MPDKNLFESAMGALPPNDHRMRAWLAILGCFTSVERSLRKRFRQVFQASLPRYDVLTALVQFPEGLTMGQLAAKLMVSKGNITGVVGRLQENRCVSQTRSRQDKRITVVCITRKGETLWKDMHAEYRAVIENVLSQVTQKEAADLTQRLIQAQVKIEKILDKT